MNRNIEWLIILFATIGVASGLFVLYQATAWITYANAVGVVFGGAFLILGGALLILIWHLKKKE